MATTSSSRSSPAQRHQYEIEVPDDHPGGLFWYHPHRHGGVAQQVRSGMAGAIVVRGETRPGAGGRRRRGAG